MKRRTSANGFRLLLIAFLLSGFGCAILPGKTPPSRPAPPPERSEAPRPSVAVPTPEKKKPAAQPKTKSKDPLAEAAERYRLNARESEKIGDFPRALQAWEIVKGILPEDQEAAGRILGLKKEIPELAERHFQKGLGHFRSQSFAPARKEFLAALLLRPDHPEAALYLKEKMGGDDFLTYPVQKGDTPRGVEEKIYEDPQKDFLVAYFNDLKPDGPLEPPRVLRLPLLDSQKAKDFQASPPPSAEPAPERALSLQANLWKAKESYRQGNYLESAALAERMLSLDPENREYRDLKNASYFELGIQLSRRKRYDEALKALQQVDPAFKEREAQITQNRKLLAEVHYLRGVKYFLDEEIESAIREWETTLSLDPAHANAKRDIQNGRNLLQNLKKIE